MSNNGINEKLYCARFTLTFDNKKVDNCAFVSAPNAKEAWDLTETLASLWNIEKKTPDPPFKIFRVYKQPCSTNPIMIWSKKTLDKVRKQLDINSSTKNHSSA